MKRACQAWCPCFKLVGWTQTRLTFTPASLSCLPLLQMEGMAFLGGLPFVYYSGHCAVDAWFCRLDDWDHSVPGPVIPSSPLTLELRQRQLLALLTKPRAAGIDSGSEDPLGSSSMDTCGGRGGWRVGGDNV